MVETWGGGVEAASATGVVLSQPQVRRTGQRQHTPGERPVRHRATGSESEDRLIERQADGQVAHGQGDVVDARDGGHGDAPRSRTRVRSDRTAGPPPRGLGAVRPRWLTATVESVHDTGGAGEPRQPICGLRRQAREQPPLERDLTGHVDLRGARRKAAATASPTDSCSMVLAPSAVPNSPVMSVRITLGTTTVVRTPEPLSSPAGLG